MNRFSAAANFNVTADAPPSYKAQLLSVLQAQKQAGGGGSAEGEWIPPEEALKQLFESMKQQGLVAFYYLAQAPVFPKFPRRNVPDLIILSHFRSELAIFL